MPANRNLMFVSEYDQSYSPKITMFICLITGSVIGLILGMEDDGWQDLGGNARMILMVSCVGLYLLRQIPVFFMFLKRRVSWTEAATISIIMGLVMGWIMYGSSRSEPSIGWVEYTGALLYLLGSVLHIAAECPRYRFKQDPDNQGKLYTQGVARYGRNMNYTGDLILFTGLAMISAFPGLYFVPLGMFLNFAVFIIPEKDRYLAEHYPDEWPEYAAQTRKLIPWIY